MIGKLFLAAAVVALANLRLPAQTSLVAVPHAPMGWNSWDAYGLTITEQQFRDNAGVLKQKLKPAGYNYAVIDEGWFFFNPEARSKPETLKYALDEHGRYVPVPERFPSAIVGDAVETPSPGKLAASFEPTSFKPLADWVHAQGLKFGIHIVRGIPRAAVERNLPIADSNFTVQDAADQTDACPWDPTNWGVKDTPAGQAWYDSLVKQYAGWGVDLLKVDCISDHPYKADEIRMIRRAIDKAGRPMVLSLSPGPTNPSHAAEVGQLATMWRISNDVWDVWDTEKDFPQSIKGQFDRAAAWARLPRPQGTYADLDMLPLGELRPVPGWGKPRRTQLTPDEQQTLFTLWALNRSPLILGANLTLLDPATLALVTDPLLLSIDQNATHTEEVVRQGDLSVWRADMPRGRAVVGLFNRADRPMPMTEAMAQLPRVVHWKSNRIQVHLRPGASTRTWTAIPPHGCVLVTGR